MTRWTAFAGFVGVVLGLLLALTRLSAAALSESSESRVERSLPSPTAETAGEVVVERKLVAVGPDEPETGPIDRLEPIDPPSDPWLRDVADSTYDVRVVERAERRSAGLNPLVSGGRSPAEHGPLPSGRGGSSGAPAGTPASSHASSGGVSSSGGEPSSAVGELSTGTMLANVAVSQGVFGVLIAAAAWWADVPAFAVGLDPLGGLPAITIGLWAGITLWGVSELGSRAARRLGIEPATGLRETLAPTSRLEWVALLGVVLPVVAGFEELLFRGVLIGALSTGFGLSAWALVVPASIAFAAGHSAQGRLGVAVTGLLGAALGAVFVVTDSLLVVIVAHYVVNAAEFLVHES